jgi:hypothetical protein
MLPFFFSFGNIRRCTVAYYFKFCLSTYIHIYCSFPFCLLGFIIFYYMCACTCVDACAQVPRHTSGSRETTHGILSLPLMDWTRSSDFSSKCPFPMSLLARPVCFLSQCLMYPRLASNSPCSRRWSKPPYPPVCTSWVLAL